MSKTFAAAVLAATILGTTFAHADTIIFDDQAMGAAPAGFTVALTVRVQLALATVPQKLF